MGENGMFKTVNNCFSDVKNNTFSTNLTKFKDQTR